jgi:hypothetical protein
MNTNIDYDEYLDDDIIFHCFISHWKMTSWQDCIDNQATHCKCYNTTWSLNEKLTQWFTQKQTNEFRFGFRSVLSLAVLFLGEPLCQFFIKGPGGVVAFAM